MKRALSTAHHEDQGGRRRSKLQEMLVRRIEHRFLSRDYWILQDRSRYYIKTFKQTVMHCDQQIIHRINKDSKDTANCKKHMFSENISDNYLITFLVYFLFMPFLFHEFTYYLFMLD